MIDPMIDRMLERGLEGLRRDLLLPVLARVHSVVGASVFKEISMHPEYFDFGLALSWMRGGGKVTRQGWNGKDLWLDLEYPEHDSKTTVPFICLNYPDHAKTTPGARVPWTPSQTDMLATDWMLANDRRHSDAG